jgi:hypothetical protein
MNTMRATSTFRNNLLGGTFQERLYPSFQLISCQVGRRPANGTGKRTFAAILSAAQRDNVTRLKDRAFVANRVAKSISGISRRLCYQVKDKAISALVRCGAASVYTFEVLTHGVELGVAFAGGGKLHALPSRLDANARLVLQQQLLSAFELGDQPSGSNEAAEGFAR